jgi:glycosyltransferase involved in cell wall biosynthesis
MKVVIANFGKEVYPDDPPDYELEWRGFSKPEAPQRSRLMELSHEWGFHIFSIGVHLLDSGLADEMEFWNFEPRRRFWWHRYGFYWMNFHNEQDLAAYLKTTRPPDLFIQHGGVSGQGVLKMLEGESFRVYVPALRSADNEKGNFDAECFLVDDPVYLDQRSLMYVPVVNTEHVKPSNAEKQFDFIYLAQVRPAKRHDIIIEAARKTGLRGHFHPVEPSELDLQGTRITTTGFNAADPVALMQAARIAVYSGIRESSPAAMWECVACDLPIVVNAAIAGGRHVVEPGVTGELPCADSFADVMSATLANIKSYHPRDWLLAHWDTLAMLDRYLWFFREMGWRG